MKRQKPRHGHGRSAGVRLFGSRRASILVCVIAGVLAVAGILAGVASAAAKREREARLAAMTPTPTETPSPTPTPTPTPSPSPTPEPTPTPSPTPEPEPETFLISFAGDCTLGDDYKSYGSEGGFVDVVGTDYGYPFRGVMDLFGNDEVTFVNLEGVLSMDGYAADKLFCFRASEDYVKVLTEGSVELVTLANNHSEDFGEDGYDGTKKTLTDAGIPFVEDRSTLMFTSRNGLKLGIYAALWPSEYGLEEALSELREAGADLIICAFHWGEEGAYRPTDDQEYMAHVAIDCGADIVFGCHPHVLQPVEVYEGGVIYYSLGNFSFGGNGNPRDKDTAVIQQEVIREPDGTVHLGETILVPCRLSSVEDENDYQPVILDPKEDQEEYDRAMSKLDGTFDGPDLVVDYSSFYASPAPSADPGAPSGEDGEAGGAGSESGTEPEGETGTEPEVEAGEDGGSESEAEGGGSESPGEEPGDGGEDGSEGSGEGSGDGEEGGGTE